MKKLMLVAFAAAALICQAEIEYFYAFNDDGGITLTGIKSGTPSGALEIPSVYDGHTVTRIGGYMHYKQNGTVYPITSVTIPSSVLVLEENAFCGISTLRTVIFNEGLVEIEEDAFYDCGITEVKFPASLRKYPIHAFGNNPIERISVAAGSQHYVAKNNLLIAKTDKKVVLSIHNAGDVVIPEGVEAIGNNAFEGDVVKSFSFPSTLKYIGPRAFAGRQASFPSTLDLSACGNLTKVDSEAFIRWTNLTTVKFPASLTQLGAWAFARCTALRQVYFNGSVPEIVHNEDMDSRIKNPEILSREEFRDAIYGNCDSDESNPTLLAGVTTYVQRGQGWDAIVASGVWQGCPIKYVSEGGPSDDGGFTGETAMTFNGLAKDADGVMCGIAQIATAKASKKGVKVSGFVMLEDGKKQSLKAATVPIENGKLNVTTKVGKTELALTITGDGFAGTLGEMTIETGEVGEDTGIISGTLKMSYFDAKTGKVKTKSIKLAGVASEGEAVGNLTVKGQADQSFEAKFGEE